MNHSLLERLRHLRRALPKLGGWQMEETCRARELLPIQPGAAYPHTAEEGDTFLAGQTIITGYTCGCGNEALCMLPYENEPNGEDAVATEGHLRFCAICDGGTEFPRIKAVTV